MADEQFEVTLVLTSENKTGQTFNQVTQQMQGIERQGTNLNRTNQQTTRGFMDTTNAVRGFIAVAAGSEFIRIISDLNEIGQAANLAESTFIELTGGADNAAEALELMREATIGAVDDMTLMNAANRLFLTGLAQTADQAAELTGIAVRLGGALGQDAAESIENLNAALLNNSFERLDMLGISAAAVRERVNELKEAGMDMSEAFAQATLEQGAAAVDRLGDASDVAATNMARLSTIATNAIQDVGQLVNRVLEGAAGTLMMGIDLINALRDAAERESRATALLVQAGIVQARTPLETDPGVLLTFAGLQAQLSGQRIVNPTDEQLAAAYRVLEINQRINQAVREGASWLNEQFAAYVQIREQAEAAAIAERRREGITGEIRGQYQHLFRLFEQAGGTSSMDMLGQWSHNVEFADPNRLQNVLNALMQIRAQLEIARSGNEEGMISDDELADLERTATTAEQIAQALQRGADAFTNMTLPQALGEGAGNQLFGGIGDMVLDAVRERNNLDADQLQEAADAYNLAAGRITELSITMRDTIIPVLARLLETQGADVATQRTRQVEDMLRRIQLSGIDENGLVAQAMLGASTGVIGGVDVQGRIVEPFQNAFAQIRDELGIVETDTDQGSNLLGRMHEGVDKTVEAVDTLESALDEIEAHEWRVKVNMEVNAPAWIQPLLATNGVARIVRDNGGAVPGMDRRGGRFSAEPR